MQTKINVKQALGLVGEIAELTPWRVDAHEVAEAITFGGVAGLSSAGAYGMMDSSTHTAYAGFFVRPKEHVNYGSVSSGAAVPLAANLSAPAGATVQVLTMGDIFVNITLTASDATGTSKEAAEAAAATAAKALTLVPGAKVYVTSAGVLTAVSTSNTLVGTVVVGIEAGDEGIAVAEATGSSTSWTSAAPSKTQIIQIRVG